MRKVASLFAAATLATVVPALYSQAGDPEAIQQKLNAQIKITNITADRSDIVTPGAIVALHKEGLVMYAVTSPLPPSNTYKNGKIGQGWGGFGKDFAITMMAPGGGTSASYPQRKFATEEKCWVTGIQVQKDGVLVQLYSDPYDGIRYYANLKIPFPKKKEVPSVDEALQTLAEVLTVVRQDEQAGQAPEAPSGTAVNPAQDSPQPAVSGKYVERETRSNLSLLSGSSYMFILTDGSGQQTQGKYSVSGDTLTLTLSASGQSEVFKIHGKDLSDQAGGTWFRRNFPPDPGPEPQNAALSPSPVAAAPPPTEYQDVAPPPPPPASAPTISIGETKTQVAVGFGEPLKKASLGAKDIYFYKDMKVTFTNGKVSNVE